MRFCVFPQLSPMSRADIRPTAHVLLLTGAPGVGKTTVMRRVVEALGEHLAAGFLTDEIRERGERRGFRLVTLGGREWVMAHVELPKHARVGRYGVDIAALDAAAAVALARRPSIEVYLVDEIGKMECLSARFVAAMQDLLDSDRVVIATIARRIATASRQRSWRGSPSALLEGTIMVPDTFFQSLPEAPGCDVAEHSLPVSKSGC